MRKILNNIGDFFSAMFTRNAGKEPLFEGDKLKMPQDLHEESLERMQRVSQCYSFMVSNNTDEPKTVHLFSKEIPFPEGVCVNCRVDSKDVPYEVIFPVVLNKIVFFRDFRLNAEDEDSFINCITHLTRKGTRTSSYPIYPLMYLHEMQVQSKILDCRDNFFFINGEHEMVLELEPNQEFSVSAFICGEMKDGLDETRRKQIIAEIMSDKRGASRKDEPTFDNMLPIVLENNTDQRKEVRLFGYKDFLPEAHDPSVYNGVKVYTPKGFLSYKQVLEYLKAYNEQQVIVPYSIADKVKVYSKEWKAIRILITARNIENNGKGKIDDVTTPLNLLNYCSAYQSQSVITAPFHYNYQPDSELAVWVEPKSKIVLFFYREVPAGYNENFFDKYGVVSEDEPEQELATK